MRADRRGELLARATSPRCFGSVGATSARAAAAASSSSLVDLRCGGVIRDRGAALRVRASPVPILTSASNTTARDRARCHHASTLSRSLAIARCGVHGEPAPHARRHARDGDRGADARRPIRATRSANYDTKLEQARRAGPDHGRHARRRAAHRARRSRSIASTTARPSTSRSPTRCSPTARRSPPTTSRARIESVIDRGVRQPLPARASSIATRRVEALDAKHVRFHLKQPLATFMTDIEFGIMSLHGVPPGECQPRAHRRRAVRAARADVDRSVRSTRTRTTPTPPKIAARRDQVRARRRRRAC